MGRHKPQRPQQPHAIKPPGEQRLSTAVWAQIVKAIRAMPPRKLAI